MPDTAGGLPHNPLSRPRLRNGLDPFGHRSLAFIHSSVAGIAFQQYIERLARRGGFGQANFGMGRIDCAGSLAVDPYQAFTPGL